MTRSVGVEEELYLVDPESRTTTPRSGEVVTHFHQHGPDVDPDDLGQELLQHQLETRTDPADSMDDVRAQVVAARRLAIEAAASAGLVVAATGTMPTSDPDQHVTSEPRYLDMLATYGDIVRAAGTCGMHVHVGIDSPEQGVAVVDRLGPWLPVVLAVTANSPFYEGHDTHYASWRSQVWARWPSAGPTERFGSLDGYREVSRRLQESGAARDDGMLYFDARLAADHPTVEVRVSDVCTDPDDTVLVAALLRGLVKRFAADGEGADDVAWRAELLRAAQWRAARYGLSDRLLHPVSGALVPAREVLGALVDVVREPLEEAGDLDLVQDGVGRVLAGGGASRQRAAFERTDSLDAVVDDLVQRTGSG